MNTGTKIAIGVVVVLAGFCFLWMFQLFKGVETAMDDARSNATTFGEETLSLLTLDWEFDDIKLRSAQTLVDEDEDGNLTAQLRDYGEALGQLKSSTGQVTDLAVDSQGESQVLRATFVAELVCENGSATIELDLARQPKNSWQLVGIEVRPNEVPVN